jgi:hypothetical protein
MFAFVYVLAKQARARRKTERQLWQDSGCVCSIYAIPIPGAAHSIDCQFN